MRLRVSEVRHVLCSKRPANLPLGRGAFVGLSVCLSSGRCSLRCSCLFSMLGQAWHQA